ncbi:MULTISPECIES: GNAT family N-acetyltransferase [unclassified Aureispira]|uniref:GNAT family N-acetyltransferase n=1 Tax=unclassified Aureispira TaxID=2649989 RepID=UPI000695E67F|nr:MULTISPECIES: GNAT family N-acetyltransferase [unclassified Aureispira]WMX14866.1 GNAT family N-acetyltransferase [Aureispira sp. CCB-E]
MTLNWVCKSFETLSGIEVYQLGHLRQQVFVVEQNCPYLDFDNLDTICAHVMAFNDQNQLMAYTRLVPKGGSYEHDISIGRVVTSPLTRGKGVGRLLMEKSIDYCWGLWGKQNIRISAQDYLLEFYESLGFKDTGKKYLEDNIPHTQMYLEVK